MKNPHIYSMRNKSTEVFRVILPQLAHKNLKLENGFPFCAGIRIIVHPKNSQSFLHSLDQSLASLIT